MENILGILDSLSKLEKKIHSACEEYMELSDQDFLSVFPVRSGIQVEFSNGCLYLIGPPALPRKNNNCSSVSAQMHLWIRYFLLTKKVQASQYPSGQRFKVSVVHHVKEDIHTVPNTVEAHAYINSMARILWIEDNLSVLDHEISVMVDSEKEEFCEIRMAPLGLRHHVDLEPEKQFYATQGQPGSALYSHYQELLLEDQRLRRELSYGSILFYSPLRKRSNTSLKSCTARLRKNGFKLINNQEEDNICIACGSPFIKREEYASDAYFDFLIPFLDKNIEQILNRLAPQNELILIQKSRYPDGDNIPFDRIYDLLSFGYHVPIAPKISIKYTPKALFESGIILNFIHK